MKSYVIRVYRFPKAGDPSLVGTLEDIDEGKTCGFRNLDELGELINGGLEPAKTVQKSEKTGSKKKVRRDTRK